MGKARTQELEQMLRTLETLGDEASRGNVLLDAAELKRLDTAYVKMWRAREAAKEVAPKELRNLLRLPPGRAS